MYVTNKKHDYNVNSHSYLNLLGLGNINGSWFSMVRFFFFLGIPFSFQASVIELWNVVPMWIEKKLEYWITKPLSLVGEFQICCKVLAAIHVYYSSYWAPSKVSYLKLEHLLRDFL